MVTFDSRFSVLEIIFLPFIRKLRLKEGRGFSLGDRFDLELPHHTRNIAAVIWSLSCTGFYCRFLPVLGKIVWMIGEKFHHGGCVPIWFRFYGNEMTLKWLQKIMDPRAVGDKRAVCFWNVAIFVWRGDRSEAPGKKNLIWTQGKVVKIHGLESRFPGPLLFGSIRAKKRQQLFCVLNNGDLFELVSSYRFDLCWSTLPN